MTRPAANTRSAVFVYSGSCISGGSVKVTFPKFSSFAITIFIENRRDVVEVVVVVLVDHERHMNHPEPWSYHRTCCKNNQMDYGFKWIQL